MRIRLPIFMPSSRQRLRELVTMDGITEKEQQELYDLVLHLPTKEEEDQLRTLLEAYQSLGATFRYK